MNKKFNKYVHKLQPANDHEREYIPAHERDGFSEDLVEVLPPFGHDTTGRNHQRMLFRAHKDLPKGRRTRKKN